MKTAYIIWFLASFILAIIIYTQITIFVIQPIGALPEGKTVVITRLNNTEFIESADGVCERLQGGVNLICRISVIGAVLNNATILARLPYTPWLYNISTAGKSYDR